LLLELQNFWTRNSRTFGQEPKGNFGPEPPGLLDQNLRNFGPEPQELPELLNRNHRNFHIRTSRMEPLDFSFSLSFLPRSRYAKIKKFRDQGKLQSSGGTLVPYFVHTWPLGITRYSRMLPILRLILLIFELFGLLKFEGP
jgi:hypothetical protein